MLKNYIVIAFRSMLRNKAYSFINISGLAIGLSCCLLLALYIQDEVSYDKHHKDVENIYQVTSIIGEDGNRTMRTTSGPIVWGIKDELPEIETVTRLVNPPGVSQNMIQYEDKQFYESDGYIADSTLFDVFTYDLKEGNPKKALVEANSIVITDELSKKLFGDGAALNKVISVNQGGPVGDFKVTGVLSERQGNTHIKANFFVSMTSSGWAEYLRSPAVMDQWAGQNFLLSYIKLKPGHTPEDFIPKMNKVFLKYGADDLKTLGMHKRLGIEPIQDIYLYGTFSDTSPRIVYLYVIGSIAVFILLIGCINFMNLSTAKAAKRANEVGLRKTLGAYRSSLITQFLGEAMVIVGISILMSLAIIQILLPIFNQLTLKQITFNSENIMFFFATLSGIALVTGLVAGSYPAFYLSSFQPAKVLKGKSALLNSGGFLRKSLVVFQFVIAITLVCGMIMVNKQLQFMQEKDLGFDTNNKIILPLRSDQPRANHESMANELSRVNTIQAVTGTNYIPGGHIWNDFTVYPNGSSMEKGVMIKNVRIESNYLDVMKINLVAGRTFTDNRKAESTNIILNATACKRLGFAPDELIGKQLYNDHTDGRRSFQVVGVMEDYHQVSLHEEIFPVLFLLAESHAVHNFMVVDADAANLSTTLSTIQEKWQALNPTTPFEYTFLDENIKKQYEDDQRVSSVISSFTIIAMIISCLGLYGLSTFMAERRFKEIGVRKVMGANVTQLVQMMSSEFIKLVGMAFIISVPLAWYAISSWQQTFAYKAPVSLLIFGVAGFSAMLIALLTVSFESIKAATGNPVNALRNE